MLARLPLQAQRAPAELTLLTTVSTDGATVFELSGVATDACDGMVAWSTRVRLLRVAPELASTNLFAFAVGSEADDTTRLADDAQRIALSSELVHALAIPIPDGEARTCVEVYARPAEATAATSLGRARAQKDTLPATSPAPFQADFTRCDADYPKRWCADNEADGTGAELTALTACSALGEACASDGQRAPPIA